MRRHLTQRPILEDSESSCYFSFLKQLIELTTQWGLCVRAASSLALESRSRPAISSSQYVSTISHNKTFELSYITRPQIFSGLRLAGHSLRRRHVLRPRQIPRRRPNVHPRKMPSRRTSLRLPRVRENVPNLTHAPKLSTLEPSVCSMLFDGFLGRKQLSCC